MFELVVNFILCSLAVYRISAMIALEEGPFGIFSFIHERTAKQSNWLERGLNCPLCISVWLSAIGAIWITRQPDLFILYWFAIAGMCLIIHKRVMQR